MYPEKLLTSTPVELEAMLHAREQRLKLQTNLIESHGSTLVSFTLNMVGAHKVFPLSVTTYEYGKKQIAMQLKGYGIPLIETRELREHTGYECFFVVKGEGKQVKQILTPLEEGSSLGRLFDIDVIDVDGNKLSREEIGFPPRRCLLCDETAFVCSRSRRHSVEELWHFEVQLMWDFFAQEYQTQVARLGVQSLLFEVSVTPKPGLVDQNNNGSHTDMNLRMFEKSAFALEDYFQKCIETGVQYPQLMSKTVSESEGLQELFGRLRPLGIKAECTMLQETNGVNTHKGVIFSMGLFLGALGYLYGTGESYARERAEEVIKAMCRTLESDFQGLSEKANLTHGERLYVKHGIRGIRGEALDGYPALFQVALPQWKKGVEAGYSQNDNGVLTLLTLIAHTEDSNMIHRSDYETMATIQRELQDMLSNTETNSITHLRNMAKELDRNWIAQNISPGGSADLLAMTYFLHQYQNEWGDGYGF